MGDTQCCINSSVRGRVSRSSILDKSAMSVFFAQTISPSAVSKKLVLEWEKLVLELKRTGAQMRKQERLPYMRTMKRDVWEIFQNLSAEMGSVLGLI